MGDKTRKSGKSGSNRGIGTDDSGRNVWVKPIEDVELELVSTIRLQRILESADKEQKDRIRELADGDDGFLAQSTETNRLEILPESRFTLEPVAESDDEEEVSLVSTQSLRKILNIEGETADAEPEIDDGDHGYNPYDSGPPKG